MASYTDHSSMRPEAQLACALAVLLLASSSSAQRPIKEEHQKHGKRAVWNLDGGMPFSTDGGLPGGECFRMSGRVSAPAFFDGLKRVDDLDETFFERGTEIITEFPDQLSVTFSIRDIACDPRGNAAAEQPTLTPEMINTLRLGLFWKKGVTMHLIRDYLRGEITIMPLAPYATDLAKELPKRYEWKFSLEVPSKGVSLTDSLVFLLVTHDGQLAARVSARL
ncbi:MAG TPA: hypothetical protein VLV88_14500 [Terriglobales bacterium]|nr:hypothetical protein [Terriglobales bacterium]